MKSHGGYYHLLTAGYDKQFDKMQRLLRHYDLPSGSWYSLALKLAENQLKGFRITSRDEKQSRWNNNTYLQLFNQFSHYKAHPGQTYQTHPLGYWDSITRNRPATQGDIEDLRHDMQQQQEDLQQTIGY